ncbi:sigma-54 interaction domain-containing protein [Desulfoferrobacter suflitae]|uniref:sigma-54 interaction domain-containing protein n=1 Tax=Desulfoferrobacter suflitae TaxID=2865782 RepID=UPI0021647733|nr:sigma 54-interacting transcriptional regulator [Desulfoferrobacter suflitae]MCK8600256.1 sigma 54-interacting transcriptional regulator [Desulfoferrobacter suflitae]
MFNKKLLDSLMNEKSIHRYWKEILNTMNDGLAVIGPDGAILMVNQALERMTGYSREELIGSSCALFNCDTCEIARSTGKGKWCSLFDRGYLTNKRCLLMRKDGSYFVALKNASVLKNIDGQLIGAVETLTDISEIDKRDQQIEQLSKLLVSEKGFHGIIGESLAMQRVFEIIEKAAQSDAPVIVYGESGTGKELVARAIHQLGRRREGPYIQLNCAALNESLLESELFGHVKGAFTGAYNHRVGRFEAANGGDLFLDEIGDVPLPIQVKLLRVLENKQFERVGDHRSISVDVRVITATNRDLQKLVTEGRYREDFFFRINVIPIYLPPLRERMEDIPLLVESFIRQLSTKTGKSITGMSSEAMTQLMSYQWPGNVRELKSALEYAFVIAERGLIQPDQLPASIFEKQVPCAPGGAGHDPVSFSLNEKSTLIQALQKTKGNQSEAARLLGVSRVTVWHRMKRYGVDLKKIVRS